MAVSRDGEHFVLNGTKQWITTGTRASSGVCLMGLEGLPNLHYLSNQSVNLRDPERLLEYVSGGGTLVVQYNTADPTLQKSFAPYPLELGRDLPADDVARARRAGAALAGHPARARFAGRARG